MSRRQFEELARRKQVLIMRAGQDRAELAASWRNVQSSLDLKQTLLGIGRTLKAHPVITAGASGMLASGMAGKLVKGAVQVAAISRVAVPLWTWLKRNKP